VNRTPTVKTDPRILRSLADASPRSFWLDVADSRAAAAAAPALVGDTRCDLVVVGGGFTGLWTALLAKEDNPDLDVVLLEAREVAWAASGRNGGFVASTLTHGLLNGVERFEAEMATLERMGEENFRGLEETLDRYAIDADWERNGELTVATEDWQAESLATLPELSQRFGAKVELWDRDRIQQEVHSPTFLAAAHDPAGTAIVNPAKLAWGLRRAAEQLGVRIHERSPVQRLTEESGQMRVTTPYGRVLAPRVALATNVFPSLVKRARPFVVPVWDYVLVTEPLSAEQMASIGWRQRQGIGDSANQFHYFRLTADDRILWGGYDAIYYYGNGLGERHEHRPETYAKLAEHFFTAFPQLEGLRFSHAWGGAIDTCTRFCSFWGQAHGGRVAYVMGFTGLGVGATRFGARVMLDLLSGSHTERTALDFVRSKPVPFPPEPFRYAGVQLTRWSIDQADRSDGRRNLWLRTLDRFGLGFDS
jgi:glycine/D-amino acid oxidase-like deaminating enzyme